MTKRLSRGLTFILLTAASVKAGEWEKLPPLPEPNGGFLAGASGSHVVIAGGTNWEGGLKHWLRGIYEYSPQKRRWEKAKDLEAPAAYGVPLQVRPRLENATTGFIGGTDGRKPLKVISSLDAIKTVLSPLQQLPDSIVLSAGGQVGDTAVIVGGTNDAANIAGFVNAAYGVTFAPRSAEVSKFPDYPGKPFAIAASAVAGGELFIFGGANWTGANQDVVNTDEAYALAVEPKTWRKLRSFPYAVRGMTAIALTDNVIYLGGGFVNDTEGFTDRAFLYDIAKDSYTPAPPLPYKALVALVNCDGFIYCLGGEDKPKSRVDACYRIPVADLLK
ncbi:MAG TPA: kelch repeat-containing protein [Prosthecobacter sp.]|nr:kelch repeat-containing protein [Prosthecobacter sp.]